LQIVNKADPNGWRGEVISGVQNALPAQRFDAAHSGAVNEAPSR
jgi:hypothetical protein